MRSGVCTLVVVLSAALAAPAGADSSTTTPATTATATTTTTAATTTDAAPAYAPVAARRLSSSCASAGAAAIVEPGAAPLVVAPVPASLGASAYPATDPVVSFYGADASGAACRPGQVSIRSLSLFGGAVTADSVTASGGRGSVAGLQVNGAPVTLGLGESLSLGGWGLLVAGEQVGKTLTAPLTLHLLEPRGPFPAGTVVLVGFGAKPLPVPVAKPKPRPKPRAAAPAQTTTDEAATPAAPDPGRPAKRHKHRHKKKHLPLKVTPPLGLKGYVFPVARGAGYGDSYGGPRSDIKDGWHHGDDLFAPLGTPILAVSSGTLSLVGWERVGGWRLWLEDAAGNQFYYAHLSAYSRWILKHPHVKAGQVIGFLGRTGDAFTTPPHLHFEIHPSGLLRLGYDGAVDPTTYLDGWKTEWPRTKDLPRATVLRAPKGAATEEADTVWRLLLAKQRQARGRQPRHATPVVRLTHPLPLGTGAALTAAAAPRTLAGVRASARPGHVHRSGLLLGLLLAAGLALASVAAAVVVRSRRGDGILAEPAVAAAEPEPLSAPTAEEPPRAGSGGALALLLVTGVAGAGTLRTLRRLRTRGATRGG